VISSITACLHDIGLRIRVHVPTRHDCAVRDSKGLGTVANTVNKHFSIQKQCSPQDKLLTSIPSTTTVIMDESNERTVISNTSLINPITGLQAQTHEEARILWSAASHYHTMSEQKPENAVRHTRIDMIFRYADIAFKNGSGTGKKVLDIHATLKEILDRDKMRLLLRVKSDPGDEEVAWFDAELARLAN